MGVFRDTQKLPERTASRFLMGEVSASVGFEWQQRTLDERCLTEVDNLNRLRGPGGRHEDSTLEGVHTNLLSAVKEAAMPYAISTTQQEYRDGTYWWLDQTPRQVAESGYRFHQHPAALARVTVEVAEAEDVERSLRPGFIKVFISPRMSKADAPHDAAKQEHLADDDMVRIHMLDIDEKQQVRGKFMQSVLVRHIPLRAWVAMLRDQNNIFGKSIEVNDETSALAVMKTYRELEVAESVLPEGVVSIVEAVLPYLDTEARRKVESQLLLFRGDQADLHRKAQHIADRWLGFEVALADSMHQKRATPEVERFIEQLEGEWGDEMHYLLGMHRLAGGGIFMSRELAVKIEQARQNTLWVSAAVITHNARVLTQMDTAASKHIYESEMLLQAMMANGATAQQIASFEMSVNQAVARQNVSVGAGCPGKNNADFKPNNKKDDGGGEDSAGMEDKPGSEDGPSKKKTMHCPFCSAKVYDDPCAKVLQCGDCKAKVVNGRVVYEGDGGSKTRASHRAELIKQVEEAFAGIGVKSFEAEQSKIQNTQAATGKLAMAGATNT
jgi:hypothetical protein